MEIPMSPSQRNEYQNLLNLSEEDLYSLIAKETLEDYQGVADLALKGKELIAQIHSGLYQRICVEWDFCAKSLDTDWNDKVILMASIVDIISSSCGNLPCSAVAALLIKLGLRSFCGCSS